MFATIRKRLEGWKTIILNALTGLPATAYLLYTELSTVDFTPLIPAKYLAITMVGMSVLGILLRLITTGPVGSKGEDKPTANVKAGD